MEKMANPHKSTTAAARRQDVAQRYLKGEHQADIAREVGVSQPMISKDLKIIRAQWRESSIRDFDTLKAEQLRKIDQVEAAAWIGYAKSQLDGERTVKERAPGGDKVSTTTEKRAGDKGWLHTILAAIERRCSLLGLDEPTRYTVDFDSLSDSQLERLSRGESPATVLAQPGPPPMAEA